MTSSARVERSTAGVSQVALAAALWGTWPLFIRYAAGVGTVSPVAQSAVVMSVIGVTVSLWAFFGRPSNREPIRLRELAALALYGAADALNMLFFLWAYQETTVAIAIVLHYVAPVLVSIGAWLFLREGLSGRVVLCAIASLCGLALLLQPWSTHASASHHARGALFAAASAVLYACTVLQAKTLGRRFRPAELQGYHCLFSAGLLLCAVSVAEWRALPLNAAAGMALGALLCGTVGGLLFVRGLQHVSAGIASNLTLLEPVVAVGISYFWFGERLNAVSFVGALVVLGSTALVATKRPTVASRTACDSPTTFGEATP